MLVLVWPPETGTFSMLEFPVILVKNRRRKHEEEAFQRRADNNDIEGSGDRGFRPRAKGVKLDKVYQGLNLATTQVMPKNKIALWQNGTLLINGVEKYYDIIGNWGHPFHTCSAQKGAMGMSLENLYQFDAIITPTAPCDSTCASYPFFKYEKNFPLIIADMPFLHGEKSYKYYAEQLKLSLSNLGEVIGQEPNFARMRKALEAENEVSKLRMELFDLIKAVPSPIENIFNPISAASTIFLSGTPENISFYRRMLEIAKTRYKNNEHHGGEEKIRSIWPYMVTFFDISLCEWLDRKLGMSVLLDIFNYNLSDPIDTKSDLDTVFNGMARKAMSWPMIKQSTDFYYPFLDDCIKMAKDFSADCFVYTQSIACKQFGGVPQLLREALMDEVGIPMLVIDFDVGDARMTSTQAFKDKISMFVQTLL